MTQKKSQFLGHVFEGAFKLGFLRDRLEDYESFKRDGVFRYIREKYVSENIEDLLSVWIQLEKGFSEGFEKLDLRYTEKNLIYFLFLLGYYEGLYYGKSFGKVELVKYDIGEASDEAGRYKNADLIFIHNHTLYVLEFKLAGAQSKAEILLEGQGMVILLVSS
ncbi:hypothetical protein [Thermocrinis sp.]